MKLEIKFIAPTHKTNCPREAFLSECSKIRFAKMEFRFANSKKWKLFDLLSFKN